MNPLTVGKGGKLNILISIDIKKNKTSVLMGKRLDDYMSNLGTRILVKSLHKLNYSIRNIRTYTGLATGTIHFIIKDDRIKENKNLTVILNDLATITGWNKSKR